MNKQLPMHLAIRPLNVNDVDQVHALESQCFPESEAASKETIRYRLAVCPELSSGLFIRTFGGKYSQNKNAGQANSTTENESRSLYSDNTSASSGRDYTPDEKSSIVKETLIGHVMATKMRTEFVDDESMQVPKWFLASSEDKNARASASKEDEEIGHIESSNYIGLHSIAIHPDYRGKKIGTLLLHDYIQKLSNQQVAASISIIAKEHLLRFYKELGFEDKGISKCRHGGAEWHDLECLLTPEEDRL